MSSFRCLCGAATRGDDAPDASLVACPLLTLDAIESCIVAAVKALNAAGARSDPGVGEDIVYRERNDGFLAMFRCPASNCLWLCDPVTTKWSSFRPERGPSSGKPRDSADPAPPRVRMLRSTLHSTFQSVQSLFINEANAHPR